MKEIDFTADSPDQLYAILKDFPNQDDSEEILEEKGKMFHVACEALGPLTFNSSNKTKLELLQLALDFHLELRSRSVNWDFHKFAVNVLKYEHFKETKRFFGPKIIDLSNPTYANKFLEVGVKCLEQHLGLGNLSQMHENGEYDELKEFCEEVMAIKDIRVVRIQYLLGEFSEKLSEEE